MEVGKVVVEINLAGEMLCFRHLGRPHAVILVVPDETFQELRSPRKPLVPKVSHRSYGKVRIRSSR